MIYCGIVIGCFQWFKDTKMKANHNDMYGEYL